MQQTQPLFDFSLLATTEALIRPLRLLFFAVQVASTLEEFLRYVVVALFLLQAPPFLW